MNSAVAGILDRGRGLRVIVTQRWRMRYHVKKGERLFVVPGLEVKEPVPWHDIPGLIRKVERYIHQKAPAKNECGECRQCCITGEVEDGPFYKPAHSPCKHLCKTGCGIYVDRPSACKSYRCLWLQSQGGNRPMSPDMRPDRLGVIFSKNDYDAKTLFIVVVKGREQALDAVAVREFIAQEKSEGVKAEIIA